MDDKEYFWLTRKKEPKTKPKSRPLPKATQKYLEAEEEFTQALDNLGTLILILILLPKKFWI
ncbi:hypothetical protein [Acinetobacter baumannii]|uniref:hypothetical protein n=1 Tax=Acinetobacter baumannii TaxID=470 RepID=UPI000940D48A|nr:hypothetical protein [Acinetobacter baumannii]